MVLKEILYYAFICLITYVVADKNESRVIFKGACEIHSPLPSNDSSKWPRSPGRVLPQHAEINWLYASKDEIREWYRKGKAECTSYLRNNKIDISNHAPIYNEKREGDLRRCRGTELLYDITGMLVWAFGPLNECPTYSKCWFGLLTCGTPKVDAIKSVGRNFIQRDNERFNGKNKTLPEVDAWSIRALRVHTRVLGLENVSPDQRLVRIPLHSKDEENTLFDEVIIGQYVLTIPYDGYRLEIRQDEFYPSSLYRWNDHERNVLGMDNSANVYLGGNEERCRPWTRCVTSNYCCGCDEKAYVRNTPVVVNAADAIEEQCGIKRENRPPLPLCPPLYSSAPGRWINSASQLLKPSFCNDSSTTVFTAKTLKRMKNNGLAVKSGDWFEASGDPCFIRDTDPEELKTPSWFFAPYSCRYHFYTGNEIRQCLRYKGITHIHIHGDSMARDFYAYLTRYLGVSTLNEDQLKKLTNEIKEKRLKTKEGDILVSEGYSWDFDPKVLDQVKEQPIPQVVMTNYRLAHNIREHISHREFFESSELAYWKSFFRNTSSSSPSQRPKYYFYQSAKDLHGKRNQASVWSADNFRRNSDYTRAKLAEIGFIEVDEFVLTAARIDTYRDRMDGWHFWGTMRQMESVVFVNMLCNDWYVSAKRTSALNSKEEEEAEAKLDKEEKEKEGGGSSGGGSISSFLNDIVKAAAAAKTAKEKGDSSSSSSSSSSSGGGNNAGNRSNKQPSQSTRPEVAKIVRKSSTVQAQSKVMTSGSAAVPKNSNKKIVPKIAAIEEVTPPLVSSKPLMKAPPPPPPPTTAAAE